MMNIASIRVLQYFIALRCSLTNNNVSWYLGINKTQSDNEIICNEIYNHEDSMKNHVTFPFKKGQTV